MRVNGQSEIKKIRSILLADPRDTWINQENIDRQWQNLNFTGRPDYEAAVDEYSRFVKIIETITGDIYFMARNMDAGLDALYIHDPVVIIKKGAILCNMGKTARRGEPAAVGAFLQELKIPVLGKITGEGKLEGGDIVWLDERTLCVGEGYRTNPEGIRQLKELTSDLIDDLIVVPLPHGDGPDDVLHLMSIISPVDENLAVIYSRLMPVRFRNFLIDKGYDLIEVPDNEYKNMACNILTLEPRKVIMLEGNPVTKKLLMDKRVEVLEYKGDEISRKGAGGPTCLTRPLLRSPE